VASCVAIPGDASVAGTEACGVEMGMQWVRLCSGDIDIHPHVQYISEWWCLLFVVCCMRVVTYRATHC
jgi:hypothetical protein